MNRYARQIILPELGQTGQDSLSNSHVLIIGAGGLGVPVLQYLVGAGVGKITLVDPDIVEQSNLHRQTLYGTKWIGQPKVLAAQKILHDLNPECEIDARHTTLDPANAPALVASVDLVLDCADSFAASYILSDICLNTQTPLISASALGLSGYVGGFCASAPSLRAVFPDLPDSAASCATAGVLGPVVGTLGAMQAQMALSVLLKFEPSPLGQMVQHDAKSFRTSSFRFDNAPEPTGDHFAFVAQSQFTKDDMIVELRDEVESPTPAHPDAIRSSVADISRLAPPAPNQRVVMCCRSGLRSWQAATKFKQKWDGQIVVAALGDN
ncbi:thiamine biosynthesis protein ThiF [Amylibacter kogurei]|uniref:Thiamine biosynthesis protein ThiF n=2 Tax=Paramylibacter kogurei TaxID=1889778 RepID=A0A2G5KA19_9RHOB|nr:thiamine biosynthesis protein ThiF [Amylibacter kogurei]